MNMMSTISKPLTSQDIREDAQRRLKAMFPTKRPRFGDARDNIEYDKKTGKPTNWPCTSLNSLSTMPRRQRG